MFFKFDPKSFYINLASNIKPNTWLFTSHNGATLVVHSWSAYISIQNIHLGNTAGVQRKTWRLHDCHSTSLVFTDRPELIETTSDNREVGRVCGSNREFEMFRQQFIVEPHALYVPNREDLLKGPPDYSNPLGKLSVSTDFFRVIAHANYICSRADTKIAGILKSLR